MSKTIPIWACVLNRALADFRPPRTQEDETQQSLESIEKTQEAGGFVSREDEQDLQKKLSTTQESGGFISWEEEEGLRKKPSKEKDWNDALHLPLWVSDVEFSNIESRVGGWVESLKLTGADLAALAKLLKKPLRPLWISQKTVIWLNEVPDLDDWDFTPIILVSASRPSAFTQRFADAEFSWSYIPGAADDEESWARGLTPDLFWKNSSDIISGGPSACNGKVADIVEKDRVYRAVRGHYTPQVRVVVKAVVQNKLKEIHREVGNGSNEDGATKPLEGIPSLQLNGEASGLEEVISSTSGTRPFPVLGREFSGNMRGFHWIGSTGLAVRNADCGHTDSIYEIVDCIISCGTSSTLSSSSHTDSFLYLPILGSKFDRYSLQNHLAGHLAKAVAFAREKLRAGSTVLIYCSNGEDISVCVCGNSSFLLQFSWGIGISPLEHFIQILTRVPCNKVKSVFFLKKCEEIFKYL